MKNWKCSLGFHDWEYIEQVKTMDVVKDYMDSISENGVAPIIYYKGSCVVENKVCLRCGAVVDDIADFTVILPILYEEEVTKMKDMKEEQKNRRKKSLERFERAKLIYKTYKGE